jgi:hypothetical protein
LQTRWDIDSVRNVIRTARHVDYALGYIALGLLDEASDELEAVAFDDRRSVPVSRARVELHMAAKHWDIVIGFASALVDTSPELHEAWIAWAYALRELNRVVEALAVLDRGVLIHGDTHPVFHYNLACYHSLLGNFEDSRLCLTLACEAEKSLRTDAKTDPDLQPLRDKLGMTDLHFG